METEIEFVQSRYIYEMMDISGRTYVESTYDVAQYLMSSKMIGPVTIKKIAIHRVMTEDTNEPTS